MTKKKFFNTKVKTKRKKMIKIIVFGTIAIILVAATGAYLVFKGINGSNNNNKELLIKQEIAVEVNDTVTDELFFNTKNPNLDNVIVEYPANFDNKVIGQYKVKITVSGKEYTSVLNVVDTTGPVLSLKDLKMDNFKIYNVNDFVESCTDNSGKECIIEFFPEGVNQKGEKIDYANIIQNGTHEIKIVASDASGNQSVKSTKLIIGKKDSEINVPVTCDFGDANYDSNQYVLASSVANNNCAINTSLYNDENLSKNVNNMLSTETIRIKKDLDKLSLNGTIALNRTVNVIMNNAGTGMVGYELHFTATITEDEKSEVVVEYKINSDGNRIFINNPHDLSK